MITVQLEPQAEKRARENPYGLDPWPLFHQMRTVNALRESDVVMNTYNTGTGKTVASLLQLLEIKDSGQNVLFIAPTNALLEQHAEDIEDFIKRNELDFVTKKVTAASVRALAPGERPGLVLHNLIRNYLQYEEGVERKPMIMVVNPDIFYYAMFGRYGRHDRRNLLEDFLLRFNYIVVDEFHYYDNKQLANFLFVLALFDQFGYFEVTGRKVCLLSATPTAHVRTYLDRLFGERWQLVAPENEPAAAYSLETTPSLSPLSLALVDSDLTDWIELHRTKICTWLEADLDGAIISGSLWRVNHGYQTLRRVLSDDQLGRITGPEPTETRREATARDLILASPTVDIGYNFKKKNKRRQNIDFLVCDAAFRDELLQRVGRAGRILGKEVIDQTAEAVVLLPSDALEELRELDGKTISRTAFNERVNNCAALPARHNLTRYIETHAITECFYPIFQLGSVMPMELHGELEALFDRVCEVFAPGRDYSYAGLKYFFFKYQNRQRWLQQTSDDEIASDRDAAEAVADWLEWLDQNRARPDVVTEVQPVLSDLLRTKETRTELRQFVRSQLAVTEALFSFRDSFQGPRAVIYDRKKLLSSEKINVYDLFHLLRHYELSPPLERRQFCQQFGETNLKGDFYFVLLGWRAEKLSVELVYESEEDREEFERMWCHAPVGISGLQLQVREKGGNALAGGIDGQIVNVLRESTVVGLIVSPEASGVAYGRLKGSSIWSRRLVVRFPDGFAEEGYSIFLGAAALFAHAELKTHFWLRERMKSKAIIL